MDNKSDAIVHLQIHQEYPATKQELVASCDELSDFSESDKAWFKENLPEGTYESAEDVIQALGWEDDVVQFI